MVFLKHIFPSSLIPDLCQKCFFFQYISKRRGKKISSSTCQCVCPEHPNHILEELAALEHRQHDDLICVVDKCGNISQVYLQPVRAGETYPTLVYV